MGLSQTAYHFLGGLLKHARAYTAVCNPTVNSYKRLVPGYEAPVYVAWAAEIVHHSFEFLNLVVYRLV